jgi:hypothetical protein
MHRVWVTEFGLAAAFSPRLSSDEAKKLLGPEETAWMLKRAANAMQHPGGSADSSLSSHRELIARTS